MELKNTKPTNKSFDYKLSNGNILRYELKLISSNPTKGNKYKIITHDTNPIGIKDIIDICVIIFRDNEINARTLIIPYMIGDKQYKISFNYCRNNFPLLYHTQFIDQIKLLISTK